MSGRPGSGNTQQDRSRQQAEVGTKQLTPRQVAFASNVLEGRTLTEAARRAGYSDKNLAQSGHQALKAIRLKLPELMDELGLTERTLIEKHLVPLLSATITKFFQHEGRVKQKREVADNDARLKALESLNERWDSLDSGGSVVPMVQTA